MGFNHIAGSKSYSLWGYPMRPLGSQMPNYGGLTKKITKGIC